MPSFPRGLRVLLVAVLLGSTTAIPDAEEGQTDSECMGVVPKHSSQGVNDEPPEKPQNFHVFPQSSSTVLGVWDPPSSDEDVVYYSVYAESENEAMGDRISGIYYFWNFLEACTTYTFSVRAVSSKGNMSEPALAKGGTEGGTVPPDPQGLKVKEYTHTTVTLAWEKPNTECYIAHYRVKYNGEGSQVEENVVPETTLILSDLLPETAYTFIVNAFNSEGEGPANTVNQSTTPDPAPQNLVAEGFSTSIIDVSWSAPNTETKPSYYLVSSAQCMGFEATVYGFMFAIKELEPCQWCNITVKSYYSDSGSMFPATTSGVTKGGAPPPPKGCSVEVNDKYIAVNWKKPTSPCDLGPYNVMWTWKKLWGSGEEESDSKNITGLSHTVYSPPPYHRYTFKIAASIEGIFGSYTWCIGTSLELPAGPPEPVSVELDEQGVVRVTWKSPAEQNGKILQYGIFVNDGESPTKNVSEHVLSTTISVTPCVRVGISVAALNHAGWGERSEEQSVTVIDDVLPTELRCPEPKPEVQVCWEPYSSTCPASQYNLKWEGDVLWSNTLTDSNNTTLNWSESEICYNIPSTPYTEYSIELSVGLDLNETINCLSTTPMAAPGPPTLEKLKAKNLTITVTWKEPKEKNGIISSYQVEWTDWNGNEDSHFTDGNTFSYQILEQSCGGKVDVTVRAKTADYVDFGERSPIRSAFLVNSISNLKCEPTEPGVIALSWEVEDLSCPVHMYNVTWSFVSLWSEDAGSGWESVDGNVISAPLESLPPFSNVSVEIHVDNSPEVTSCTATTLQEVPGPPILEELQVQSLEIIVTWKEPEEKNGVIIAYQVEWMNWNGVTNSHSTDGNTFSYKIVEQACGEKVDVTVRAKTVDFGERSPPRSVLLVNSISNLTCEPTEPGVIALSWEIKDVSCPLQMYNVTWSFVSLWSEDKGSNWTSIDGEETSAILTSLPPYSMVTIDLHFNSAQESISCTTITPEETSSAPTDLQQVAKDIHSVTVEWSFPEFLRGKFVAWYVNWTSAIGHYVSEHVIGNPEERMLEIGSLEPSEVYYVYVMAVNGAGRGGAAVAETNTEYVPRRKR